MASLGEYIHTQRIVKNLSVRKLAELSKVSHTEIHRIENGKRKHPSPLVLKSIAAALNIDFEDIMKAAGYIEDKPYIHNASLILSLIADLNEQEIQEVQDFINFLRNKHNVRQ